MHLFRRLRESHSRYGRADPPVLVAMLAFGFYWLATKDRPTSPKTRSTLSIVLRDHPWMGLRTLHHDHALDALRDPTSVSSKHAMPHRSPFAPLEFDEPLFEAASPPRMQITRRERGRKVPRPNGMNMIARIAARLVLKRSRSIAELVAPDSADWRVPYWQGCICRRKPKKKKPRKSENLRGFVTAFGGDGGIRTLDPGFGPDAPLAGECLRPLGHVSQTFARTREAVRRERNNIGFRTARQFP